MKPIKELIEEARELGVDLHDYVAQEVCGAVNMETRLRAKQLTYGILYGASPHVQKRAEEIKGRKPNVLNSKPPWLMTEEQHTAQSKVMSREFKKEHMNEPFKHFDDCPAVDIPNYRPPATKHPQAEDQMHRAGVVQYKVRIFDEDGTVAIFPVHATSTLDARCIAYIIDRGRKMQQWDDEQIELALACTEIVG